MSETITNLPFYVGAYITGTDRTYKRSLYKVLEYGSIMDAGQPVLAIICQCVAFGGIFFNKEDQQPILLDHLTDKRYRLATDGEVAQYLETGECP